MNNSKIIMNSILDNTYDDIEHSIKEYILFSEINEYDSILSEGIFDKFGIKAHKGKGLLSYLKGSGKFMFNIIKFAMKKDKKGLANELKSVNKEDVIDFVMKLDQATLHLITGPLHFIEAVSGWHITANTQKVTNKVKDIIVAAYDNIMKHLNVTKHSTLKDVKAQIKQIS